MVQGVKKQHSDPTVQVLTQVSDQTLYGGLLVHSKQQFWYCDIFFTQTVEFRVNCLRTDETAVEEELPSLVSSKRMGDLRLV